MLLAVVRAIVDHVVLVFASTDGKDAEILALRHQILVLQRQVPRPRFEPIDQTLLALLGRAVGRSRLAKVM